MVLQAETPPVTMDDAGSMRVGRTRLLVDLVVEAFRNGASAEQIVQDYDVITLAEAYGVIAWYLRHREEVDAYLLHRGRDAQAVRAKIEAHQKDLSDIRERLLRRRNA